MSSSPPADSITPCTSASLTAKPKELIKLADDFHLSGPYTKKHSLSDTDSECFLFTYNKDLINKLIGIILFLFLLSNLRKKSFKLLLDPENCVFD